MPLIRSSRCRTREERGKPETKNGSDRSSCPTQGQGRRPCSLNSRTRRGGWQSSSAHHCYDRVAWTMYMCSESHKFSKLAVVFFLPTALPGASGQSMAARRLQRQTQRCPRRRPRSALAHFSVEHPFGAAYSQLSRVAFSNGIEDDSLCDG